MARFRVTAPDGRILTIEGDTPPTDTDLDELFKTLPARKTEAAPEEAAEPTPDGGDLEGIVTDLPGGGYRAMDRPMVGPGLGEDHSADAAGPYKTLAELPKGMLKSVLRNLLGAGKLTPPALATRAVSAATGAPDPLGQALEQGREELAPSTVGEEKAADIEKLLEFFVPGPAGKGGLGRKVLQAALESGAVGSAQEGELNPEAAVGGAAGSVVGHLGAESLTSIARKLLKSAPQQFAQVARPKAGYHGDKVIQAAEEALEDNIAGGIPTMAALEERTMARAEKLKQARDLYRKTASRRKMLPADAVKKIQAAIDEDMRVNAQGEPYSVNPQRTARLKQMIEEIRSAEGTPPSGTPAQISPILNAQGQPYVTPAQPPPPSKPPKVPIVDLEDRLQALTQEAKVYDRTNPAKAPAEEGTRLMRARLNEKVPGRAEAMEPYSRALALAQNMKQAMAAERLRKPSAAGQQFALRGAVGAGLGSALGYAGGGGLGAALGGTAAATAAIEISRFIQSPLWRSMSAQQKYNAAKAFIDAAPELEGVVTDMLSAYGAEEHGPQTNSTAIQYALRKLGLKTPEAPQ